MRGISPILYIGKFAAGCQHCAAVIQTYQDYYELVLETYLILNDSFNELTSAYHKMLRM